MLRTSLCWSDNAFISIFSALSVIFTWIYLHVDAIIFEMCGAFYRKLKWGLPQSLNTIMNNSNATCTGDKRMRVPLCWYRDVLFNIVSFSFGFRWWNKSPRVQNMIDPGTVKKKAPSCVPSIRNDSTTSKEIRHCHFYFKWTP